MIRMMDDGRDPGHAARRRLSRRPHNSATQLAPASSRLFSPERASAGSKGHRRSDGEEERGRRRPRRMHRRSAPTEKPRRRKRSRQAWPKSCAAPEWEPNEKIHIDDDTNIIGMNESRTQSNQISQQVPPQVVVNWPACARGTTLLVPHDEPLPPRHSSVVHWTPR